MKPWINILATTENLFEVSENTGIITSQQSFSMTMAGMVVWVIIIGIFVYKNKKYKETSYYKNTKNSCWKLFWDKGKLGEYAIFKRLKHLETENTKFLFNVYIPKEDRTTTEIDVLLICPKGIVVFESKNFSGWIFGNESSKNWTQTLPHGRGRSEKMHFLNPIIQNRGHIKHLKNFLGIEVNIKSVIVFSDRCTLKELTLKSDDVKVINRYDVVRTVNDIFRQSNSENLNENKIAEIYDKLCPLSQVDNYVKEQHIQNIHRVHKDVLKKQEEEIVENLTVLCEHTVDNIVTEEIQATVPIKHMQCPKCAGKLVLRTAKKGKNLGKQFYGCSNYPKCRYVQNVEKDGEL